MVKHKYPISHWSYSSLIAYLRNPLAWHKRYVEKIYDVPRSPASIIGSAGHKALEHFYTGFTKPESVELGLHYMKNISEFEIDFGKAKTVKEKQIKRKSMEREYLQAIGFYLARPPKHKVVAVESGGVVRIPQHPLPIKAISDLVVESKTKKGALDIIDHKFVDSFSKEGKDKTLYMLQAIFNYYTVREMFKKPVVQFVVYECKKRKNADGSTQLKKIVIPYDEKSETFTLFHALLKDATEDVRMRKVFLPNPSDMFEGEDSFSLYRLSVLG